MSVLVMGNHVWGHGDSLDEAKKNFRANGGALSQGYSVINFAEDQKFGGVDDLGRYHWEGSPESPDVYDVTPRRN